MVSQKRFSARIAAGFITLLLSLTACENGIIGTGDNPGKHGIAQKGPFAAGSSITIVTRPGPDYLPVRTDQVQTLDDIGTFEFNFQTDTLYDISVSGMHFNEITGQMSTDPITLKSTYYHLGNTAYVSINILTHIVHSRISFLIANQGAHPADATAQASQELANSLTKIVFADHLESYPFSNMTVYNLADTDPNANAVLLFISSAFYQQSAMYQNSRTLSDMLATLADDLEQDGVIDGDTSTAPLPPVEANINDGPVYISSLDVAARFLNPDSIADNLIQYSIAKTGHAIPVPDISFLLDHDADGITNNLDTDDDGDGMPDTTDTHPYQFEIIPAAQTFLTSQNTSVAVDLDFVVPENPESNPVYLGFDQQPAHGSLSGVYPNLIYTPETGFTGMDSFTYTVNCITCAAIPFGVYSSNKVTVTINVL